jgi:hypothetical protein
MELLLNLIWVLLAVPAFWLWRREALPSHRNRYLSPVRCVLALGFVLLLLFPVISATDDLRAMQTETEECPSGRRAYRSAENERDHSPHMGTAPALVGVFTTFAPADEFHGLVISFTGQPPVAILHGVATGRAPPSSLHS